jgi:hypothetical protein
MRYPSSTLTLALTLSGLAQAATAQMLPPSSPDVLAAALQTGGLKAGSSFRSNGQMLCKKGAAEAGYLYRCTAAMTDGERGGRTAAVEIMIFQNYDFARLEAPLKQAVTASSAPWKADYSNNISITLAGRRYSPRASCHQARGPRNGLAYCLTAASSNVAVFTQVAPLRAGITSADTNTMDEDMERAAILAGNGLEAILSAADTAIPPQKSTARADDFCPNLKTAIASARTNFANLAGSKDELIPSWRNAKSMLPFATDCSVDTDRRNISYFCSWEKEQPAAVNARYKYTVQQTDQCLAGFQKTIGDRMTTWQISSGGTVIVDARHVMKNTQTWALTLTVKR